MSWMKRLRLWLYRLLSVPYDERDTARIFRFRLPFILKITHRLESTEADALRYLNTQFQGANHLPIPRLYDSFALEGKSYSLISKIPGRTMLDVANKGDHELDYPMICGEIEAVMRRVWALHQPEELKGQIMVSASGGRITTDSYIYAGPAGPYATRADCYALFTGYETGDEVVEALSPKYGDVQSILEADPLVFTHTDLRMQNVLLTPDFHLSGIIDWEDAGWLPMERQWFLLSSQRPLLTRISYCQYWADMDVGEETRKAHEVASAAGENLRRLEKLKLEAYPNDDLLDYSNSPWPL